MGYPDFQMKRMLPDNYEHYDEIGLNLNISRSEIFPVYKAKNLPLHVYCADNEADVNMAIERGAVLITANDPVPLMTVLGRAIGIVKEI